MDTIAGLWRWITGQPAPLPPDTGQRIQEREQAAARERLLAYARRMPNESVYDYGRWAR